MPAPRGSAQTNEEQALKSTLETRLSYVITGDAEVDRISKAGLQGLTLFLAQRTALEAGEPIGLDSARDQLWFYPLIYWPLVPCAPKPLRAELEHIQAHLEPDRKVLVHTRHAYRQTGAGRNALTRPGSTA